MGKAAHPEGLDGAQGLAQNELRLKFLHPGCNLGGALVRVETVRAHHHPDILILELLGQQAGNPAVASSAHSMYIKYRGHTFAKIDKKLYFCR
jgi:hypothetical protein